MIVLDTNVLSEALKPSPEETVLRWLASYDREQLNSAVAARNISDFEHCGIAIINPWAAS